MKTKVPTIKQIVARGKIKVTITKCRHKKFTTRWVESTQQWESRCDKCGTLLASQMRIEDWLDEKAKEFAGRKAVTLEGVTFEIKTAKVCWAFGDLSLLLNGANGEFASVGEWEDLSEVIKS